MPKKSLFIYNGATNDIYRNIQRAESEHLLRARSHCEALWEIFEPYADQQFLAEIQRDFIPRYWEMYLTVTLIDLGFKVTCPKQPGPDVGIDLDGQKVWFEATCPSPGDDKSANSVPPLIMGQVSRVPNEKMILRYLNSISEKTLRQYPVWLSAGVVSPQDSLILALNPKKLAHDMIDTNPPRILQAAYPIGSPTVSIDRNSLEVIRSGYSFRPSVGKVGGPEIDTGVFRKPEYSVVSGLLCSRVDACNFPALAGDDFQFVPNIYARVPLNPDLRLRGKYFKIETDHHADGTETTTAIEADW